MRMLNLARARSQIVAMASVAAVLAFAAACAGSDRTMEKVNADAATELARISDQVARDQVTQYLIVKNSGTATDRCVQAGLVSAAFLQAKDAANYATWKERQRADCRSAGLPDR